jgi:hypothetical protein
MKLLSIINRKIEKVMPTNREMNQLVNTVVNSKYGKRIIKNSKMSKEEAKLKIKKRIPPRSVMVKMVKQQAAMRLKQFKKLM